MTRPPKIHQPLPFDFTQVLETIADENKPETQSILAKPFLKWVGGKRSILSQLVERMPKQYLTYREPFLGGGALFFATQPSKAYLSDINFNLILTYQAVRDDVDRLILNLKTHERLHSKTYYQTARERLFKEKDTTKIAALFIYLNKTCFNGLYRVNRAGFFNVPIGSYKDPSLFDEDVLRKDSEMLKGVILKQHEFSQMPIAKDNFYYLDPPYHKTYDGYNGNGFDDEEHKKLAKYCENIDEAGGLFMLSNSDTPFVRSLYSKFHIEEIMSLRSVSCKAYQRGKESEIIVRNYQ